jgi:hypothetical protein
MAEALATTARSLAIGGMLVGPDRADGTSRSGYGDARIVGLTVVTETAADLTASTISLLQSGHPYSAMALVRQIIEAEYLIWLFAADAEQARRWLNADDDELWLIFRPSEIRKRSAGRFGAHEYRSHCGLGGRPSPKSRVLLPEHSMTVPVEWLWADLLTHLSRLWRTLVEAVSSVGFGAQLPEGVVDSVGETLAASNHGVGLSRA